jgi:hypothetical protein
VASNEMRDLYPSRIVPCQDVPRYSMKTIKLLRDPLWPCVSV